MGGMGLIFSHVLVRHLLGPPPSKNHLARNIQVLQAFFLQDLQDLVLNLVRILQVLH